MADKVAETGKLKVVIAPDPGQTQRKLRQEAEQSRLASLTEAMKKAPATADEKLDLILKQNAFIVYKLTGVDVSQQ